MVNEEKIINYYSKFNDDEIQKMLDEGINKYNIILQSEKIAKIYLHKYNIHFFHQNERFKSDFQGLLIYAKHRNLMFNKESFYSECSIEDIIERINENKYKNIDLIMEYAYQYIGYLGNDTWNNMADINNDFGVEIKINEVNSLYQMVINDIMTNCTKKHKIKTK